MPKRKGSIFLIAERAVLRLLTIWVLRLRRREERRRALDIPPWEWPAYDTGRESQGETSQVR